jgi:hypothetical protein
MIQQARALLAALEREPRRVFFPFLLPCRNELDKALRRRVYIHDRPATFYSVVKKKAHDDLIVFANRVRRQWPPLEGRLAIFFHWREPNRHRDPANVADGGRKLILDAIATGRRGRKGWGGAGLIHCDGAHCTGGLTVDIVSYSREMPGVEVIVAPMQTELRFPGAEELARAGVVDLRGAA